MSHLTDQLKLKDKALKELVHTINQELVEQKEDLKCSLYI